MNIIDNFENAYDSWNNIPFKNSSLMVEIDGYRFTNILGVQKSHRIFPKFRKKNHLLLQSANQITGEPDMSGQKKTVDDPSQLLQGSHRF